MVTILRLWPEKPENLSQKVAGTTFLRQPPIRLIFALTLLIQANLSYPSCTNLPGLFNNGLASAATGQVISRQHSCPWTTVGGSLLERLFKYGVFIGAFDSMRAAISKLTECPIQNAYGMTDSMAVSTGRTIVSGLILNYLLKNGHRMDSVVYSGLYAATDAFLTSSFNTTGYDHDDTNISYIGSRINNALWQGCLAMALSIAGKAVASRFPAHKHAANLVTQLTLIYGTALAYITYFELKNN